MRGGRGLGGQEKWGGDALGSREDGGGWQGAVGRQEGVRNRWEKGRGGRGGGARWRRGSKWEGKACHVPGDQSTCGAAS